MLRDWYAEWMFRWETELTTRDENRVVRPVEWGFEWLRDGVPTAGASAMDGGVEAGAGEEKADPSAALRSAQDDTGFLLRCAQDDTSFALRCAQDDIVFSSRSDKDDADFVVPTSQGRDMGHPAGVEQKAGVEAEELEGLSFAGAEAAMLGVNAAIVGESEAFFGYAAPVDYRLEVRHPALFPTNVRPETLAQDAALRERAARGELATAEFLRFTSPVRTPYPENDLVNARWYPAKADRQSGEPARKAMIVMPQWNADAFSHNALCTMFNRFGVSALRLSKPYHDIRRPVELERSDYAVSANIGRTLAAARQAVVDIRCCVDWLYGQGYDQVGVLGTSLGSCYAFLAAAHDARLEVCAFNHASTSFGDVVWTGQSTRHIRAGFEAAGLTQERLNALWGAISPVHYMERFAATARAGAGGRARRTLVVHATYDLTFLERYSLEVMENFRRLGVAHEERVLPCGHYTTGETPYKFMDGWYLGSFVYRAFRDEF